MNQRLYRSRDDRMIGGVAGGVANYLDLDPSLVRIVWAILTVFSGGILLLLYIIMLVVVPEEPYDWSASGAGGSAPTPPPPPVIPGWVAPAGQYPAAATAGVMAAAGPPGANQGVDGTGAAEEGARPAAEETDAEAAGTAAEAGRDAAVSAAAADGVAAAGAPPPAQPAAWIAPSTAAQPGDWRAQRQAERDARRAQRRGRDGFGAVIFGLILVLVGGFFLVETYLPDIDAARFWPVLLVIVGVVLLIASFRPGSRNPET